MIAHLPLSNSPYFKFEMCTMYGGMPPNNSPETSEGSTLSNSIEILELSGIIKFE